VLKVEALTPEREEEYEEFLSVDDRVLFNSSLKFRELARRITGARDHYLVAIENGRIVGTLPAFLLENGKYGNVLNSLPWYGSNPGITVDPKGPSAREIKKALLEGFEAMARDEKAVASTIITHPFETDLDLYQECTRSTFTDSRVGLVTPIPAYGESIESDLMASFHSKTRNLVRKAQKYGMRVYHDNSADTLRFLVDTHTRNMLEVGAPPKKENLFNEVTNLFEYGQDYRIYIAELEGAKTAALLLKYYNKTVDYFTPAIVEQYRDHQPLSLLIFAAMKDAAERGMRYWNWGGTTLPSQEGVYHFKKRWGAEECQYFYFVRIYDGGEQLLSLDKETLLSEFPYFFVLPFSELKRDGN
jgi:hypothetical protein